eukprot:scaffold10484_cov31-Tisochrysis_lutea.AAC.7
MASSLSMTRGAMGDELVLEENTGEEEEELVLEQNGGDDEQEDDGPLLEENDEGDNSDSGLVLEENDAAHAAHGAAGVEGDEEELALEENEEIRPHDLDFLASAKRAEELRTQGNMHFKEGRMEEARTLYTAAIAASPQQDNAARATILTNRAAASLKLSDWAASINDCTAALTLTAIAPDCQRKALFRRATAFINIGDTASAKKDLAELPSSDPAVARLRRQASEVESATVRTSAGVVSRSGAAAGAARLVSCIAPTTPERHVFHECTLYRCFTMQTHPATELVVVDTGEYPSPFFTTEGGIAVGSTARGNFRLYTDLRSAHSIVICSMPTNAAIRARDAHEGLPV